MYVYVTCLLPFIHEGVSLTREYMYVYVTYMLTPVHHEGVSDIGTYSVCPYVT